jgi:uncharacterized membrane protein
MLNLVVFGLATLLICILSYFSYLYKNYKKVNRYTTVAGAVMSVLFLITKFTELVTRLESVLGIELSAIISLSTALLWLSIAMQNIGARGNK